MPAANGNPGVSKLARVISNRARDYTEDSRSSLYLDFGTIRSDLSLLTDTFPIPIPKKEYMVCRHVCGHSYETEPQSVGDHGSHKHTVKPPKLKKGDRVLVAWVDNEAVVIDVVWKATKL